MADDADSRDTAPLIRRAKFTPARAVAVMGVGFLGLLGLLVLARPPTAVEASSSPPFARMSNVSGGCTLPKTGTIDVYFGNGCFWERQWAYINVEKAAPFSRPQVNLTSLVGYAGGTTVASEVCYHTGDSRDYSRLSHAEVVRVTLDAASAPAQMRALSNDFFASFTGPPGRRMRPDPMDRGAPYRSLVGLPGGTCSPLYEIFAKANTEAYQMDLKPGNGGDADVFNTVWVMDTDVYPFYAGEVYHQFHCNFFHSEGMPYPDAYTLDLWRQKKQQGSIKPTGCPENQRHGPC